MAEEFKEKVPENPTENSTEKTPESSVEISPENAEERPLSTKEYLELEKDEILGPFNEYVTGEALKRPITRKDMEEHYVENKGPEAFAQKHILKARGKKEEPK